MTRWPLVLALCLSACTGKSEDDDDDDGDDTSGGDSGVSADSGGGGDGGDGGGGDGGGGDGGGDPPLPSFSCSWSGDGLDLRIVDGPPGGLDLGIAETDCGSSDCWTGEDCYLGYTSSDGTVWSWCHPTTADGAFLGSVSALDDVVEGATTLFSEGLSMTYVIQDTMGSRCWTWGDDPAYYSALGCEVLPLDCD